MKNYKKILSLIIFISLVAFCGVLYICYSSLEYFCLAHQDVSMFITLFSAPLFLFSLILLFLREEIFQAWKKFAIWWLPLSVFFILISPSQSGGSIGIGGGPDREIVTWWFAGLFAIISLVLVVSKTISLKGK